MKRLVGFTIALGVLAAACGSGRAVAVKELKPSTTPTSPAGATPGRSPTPKPKLTPTPTGTETPTLSGTITVQVWFTNGEKLFSSTRTTEATLAVGRAALNALLAGPSSSERKAGIATTIPSGTELLGLTIVEGVATVDMSGTYDDGGGSLSERARLAQVVYTITQFPTVQGVNFELDGNAVTSFSGEGIVLGHPQTRADFEDLMPAIVVDAPRVGSHVSSPFTVSGTADVFEAVVSWELLDANGSVIAEGTTNATCGTGCRGDFIATVAYRIDHEQDGTLKVFEASAKDGSPVNVVEMPLRLAA
jgi:germination protein M